MVRTLTIEELKTASVMGHSFFAEGKLPGRFVPEIFLAKWSSLMEQGIGFVLGIFKDDVIVGSLGAVVVEDLNDGELVAAEAFWFVDEKHRGRGLELLFAYEKEARLRGAVRCSMIHLKSLQPERLSKIYERLGYIIVETAYYKTLK